MGLPRVISEKEFTTFDEVIPALKYIQPICLVIYFLEITLKLTTLPVSDGLTETKHGTGELSPFHN